MEFLQLSEARYSLRKFSDRPVEAEKLAAILEAGRNAPTAHNLQPQRIVIEPFAFLDVLYCDQCTRVFHIFSP